MVSAFARVLLMLSVVSLALVTVSCGRKNRPTGILDGAMDAVAPPPDQDGVDSNPDASDVVDILPELDVPGDACGTDPLLGFNCPTSAPDPDRQYGSCCFSASNECRLANPTFRIAGLDISSPSSLVDPTVGGVLASAMDQGRMNWIFSFSISGSAVSGSTGDGQRQADGSFVISGGRPLSGSLSSETLASVTAAGTVRIRVPDDAGTVAFEFPLRDPIIERATLSEARTCVGSRMSLDYDTSAGLLHAFIPVAEADATRIDFPPIDTTLCNFIAGMANERLSNCSSIPRRGGSACISSADCSAQGNARCIEGFCGWGVLPDSLCTTAGCTMSCTPETTCNAWRLNAGFAAHGVDVR